MSHTTSVTAVAIRSANALRATVAELQAAGIKCSLVENAIPRMWFSDQINRHVKSKPNDMGLIFHQNPEECDFVLRLDDAFYDVGFIRSESGNLVPFFDDYDYRSPYNSHGGSRGIKAILGAAYSGKTEHWSGQRDAGEQQLHSIGKFLQSYSKHATLEAATNQGYMVLGEQVDEQGNIHLSIGVPD